MSPSTKMPMFFQTGKHGWIKWFSILRNRTWPTNGNKALYIASIHNRKQDFKEVLQEKIKDHFTSRDTTCMWLGIQLQYSGAAELYPQWLIHRWQMSFAQFEDIWTKAECVKILFLHLDVRGCLAIQIIIMDNQICSLTLYILKIRWAHAVWWVNKVCLVSQEVRWDSRKLLDCSGDSGVMCA